MTADAPAVTSIIICTCNRAQLLEATLRSLAELDAPGVPWDVVVVDNNSRDDTGGVVRRAQAWFPVPLILLDEPRQGKSIALNTALDRVHAPAIVFTDDDVQFPREWLREAIAPLLEEGGPDYTGGPVSPWWESPPPAWLESTGNLSATIAVLDYGAEPFCFEERGSIPLGVNMAVRRSLIDRVGGFHPSLGRTGKSLLGQEQAEFFQRCRQAGARGVYVPSMRVRHFVPAARMTIAYFARWWYWKGISHARWHAMHNQTETGVDLTRTRRLLGVPRYLYRQGLTSLGTLLRGALTGDRRAFVKGVTGVLYRIGYAREVWFGARTKEWPAGTEPAGHPTPHR